MRILIDGYNLLFQSQLVGKGRGPGWLERARQKLIAHLHSRISQELLAQTTIVFDASQAQDSSRDSISKQSVSIIFAHEHPQADDLLEELIRQHPSPKSLTVVSSDHRIQRCAKARRAQSVDSESFLDRLEKRGPISPGSSVGINEPQKSNQPLTEEQVNYWLREFG